MRIAWCFSGQIRTGIKCSKNILKFIDNYEVDFFIHTWDVETNIANSSKIYIKKKKIDSFINIYYPKKYKISNYDEYQNTINESNINSGNIYPLFIFPMFQSIYESNELKKQFELENNFKYDYVIRARPDVVYPKFNSLDNEITYIKNRYLYSIKEIYDIYPINDDIYVNDFWNKLPHSMEDLFWISTSNIMDKVCDFKQWLIDKKEYIDEDNQILLYYYVTKLLNIQVNSMKYNEMFVIRKKL